MESKYSFVVSALYSNFDPPCIVLKTSYPLSTKFENIIYRYILLVNVNIF